MTTAAEFDEIQTNEWNALLRDFDDANIFQTWTYGAVRWGEKNLSHAVFKENGEVVGLAQVRLVGIPVVGHVFAHIVSGPLWRRRSVDCEIGQFKRLTQFLHHEYVVRRGLCLRLRPNYVGWVNELQDLMAAEEHWLEPEGLVPSVTVIVDLSLSEVTLRRNMDRRWRANLRKAEQQSLSISQEVGTRAVRLFTEVHEEMQRRKGFRSDFHSIFPSLYEELPKAFQPEVFICWHEDKPVASAIVSAIGDCAIFLNGGTTDAALKVRAGYFLQWNVLRWLRERNVCRWYDLHGLLVTRGVRQFKKGLVGPTNPEITVREYDACKNSVSAAIVKVGQRIRDFRHKRKN